MANVARKEHFTKRFSEYAEILKKHGESVVSQSRYPLRKDIEELDAIQEELAVNIGMLKKELL